MLSIATAESGFKRATDVDREVDLAESGQQTEFNVQGVQNALEQLERLESVELFFFG